MVANQSSPSRDQQNTTLSLRELCEGGGGGSSTGYSENMLSNALEMDVCFHRAPTFGENGGMLS
jgi:hypothetical protein